jgi:hypothetical protein
VTDPISSIQISVPSTVQLGLWGGGPRGEDLIIVERGNNILRVKFPTALASWPIGHLRAFEVTAVGFGRTALEARTASGSSYAAPLQITCTGLSDDAMLGSASFYHGTSLEQAKKIMTMDIEPFAVPESLLLDVNEYTDFGKGFYTHPEETKRRAVEWAKRRNKEWGVVRFTLTADEIGKTERSPLYYRDKFKSRPSNSPKLFNSQPATWIEFVEFNRHIRKIAIQRPKDNDWTSDYSYIRGPIWGRGDSNLPGPPGLPESNHQINWGLVGMDVLNTLEVKRRRFLFAKHNEDLL